MLLRKLLKNNFIIVLIITSSCATKEDIERQKKVDNLIEGMKGQQEISKSLILKISNLENGLGNVSGKIEETKFSNEQKEKNNFETLREEIKALEEKQSLNSNKHKDLEDKIVLMNKSINEQKQYLENLLKEIKKITKTKKASKKNKSLFDQAIYNYQNKKYSLAKKQFIELSENKKKFKINIQKNARIIHNLGMISYIENDFKNAQIYFSKLYTDYSKNGLNSSGLFHLGDSFLKQKNVDATKETWQLLMENYPKSKYSKRAKTKLEKLK